MADSSMADGRLLPPTCVSCDYMRVGYSGRLCSRQETLRFQPHEGHTMRTCEEARRDKNLCGWEGRYHIDRPKTAKPALSRSSRRWGLAVAVMVVAVWMWLGFATGLVTW